MGVNDLIWFWVPEDKVHHVRESIVVEVVMG